ncbi:MAG: hypothetical protein RL456_1989 [Pseudomonadota bacterium]|jgi:hypothetical protein
MNFVFGDSSNAVMLLLAGGLAAAVVVWLWRRFASRPSEAARAGRPRALDAVDTVIGWPPEATRVLTLRHQRSLEVLRRAVPEHLILAQVPLSHFIKVPTRHSYVEWLRRVGHVCVDLMVCDSASNVLAVIEVRQADKTDSERARKRHQRVERVLRAAGIPLHVWNEAYLPDPLTARRTLLQDEDGEMRAPVSADAQDTRPLHDWNAIDHRRNHRGEELPASTEPPRSTWFDDLHATQPVQLDGVDVAVDAPAPPVIAPTRPMMQPR